MFSYLGLFNSARW